MKTVLACVSAIVLSGPAMATKARSTAAAPGAARSTAAAPRAVQSLTADQLKRHFNQAANHAVDAQVKITPGALLRDSYGRPLWQDEPAKTISLGSPTALYTIQHRPVARDEQNHLMYYVWGAHGPFKLGGAPAKQGYSGFVLARDVPIPERAKLPKELHYANQLDGAIGAAVKKHAIGARHVEPRPIAGKHVGVDGTADHPLSDYGYAHGLLHGFSYATFDVLSQVAGGGQVGAILHKGLKVEATDLTLPVLHTQGGTLTFRLCLVKLPKAEVALWIAEPVLAK